MTLWLLPLVLFGGAAALLLAPRRALLPWLAIAPLVMALGLALWAAAMEPVSSGFWWGPRLDPQLAVAGISRILVVLVPVIAIPVVLYAAASARSDPAAYRLLALLVAFTGAMELLVLAGDFLTLLIAWELVGACSWALIGYDWRDVSRPRAALRVFITTRTGDLGLYLAAAASVAATGSVRFEALSGAGMPALHVVAGGVLLASAAKSAQLPFSPWLFSAMAGPTAASALLHSATMVAAGAYLLARLAPLLAPTGWFLPSLAWVGLATALAGGIVASLQSDLKKALAASTSAQYGLMFVAVGAGFTAAAGVHLVTHAAFKALLFLGAGVALHAGGTGDLARLRLGSALPRIAGFFAIGALALAAVPPLGGAYSKEQILAAAVEAPSGGIWLAAGVLTAGFLSAFYAGRLYLLAFGPGPRRSADLPATAERWSLLLLAGLSVALGVLWLPGSAGVVAEILGDELPHESTWQFLAGLIMIAAAGGLCWWLWIRGDLLNLRLTPNVRVYAAGWFGLPTAGQRIVVSPALQFSRALATFDDRVIDAGIRAAARLSILVSRATNALAEDALRRAVSAVGDLTSGVARGMWFTDDRGVDAAVERLTRAVASVADASGTADDNGIDTAVEMFARQVGVAGRQSRRLQTGLAHDYYLILAVGAVAVLAVATLGR